MRKGNSAAADLRFGAASSSLVLAVVAVGMEKRGERVGRQGGNIKERTRSEQRTVHIQRATMKEGEQIRRIQRRTFFSCLEEGVCVCKEERETSENTSEEFDEQDSR